MGKQSIPPHGTVRRYRLELKTKAVCEKCRSANSKAKAAERAARNARAGQPNLSIVPDPQTEPTNEPMPPAATTEPTPPPALGVTGIENAVRNLLNTTKPTELLTHVYGQIVIVLARAIAVADPKDIPKLTEEMVDAAKLMKPESAGGQNDIFSGLGHAT